LETFRRIARVAAVDTTVLLQGESGTGKELAAQSIHRRSARAAEPFVTVNVAAVPDTLFEDQLFGHEVGAFTDARAAVAGLLDRANGGILFFDEIGELPLSSQAKLLRVLEDRQFARLGSHRPIPLDVRVFAATNRDLEAAVDAGLFRADLYYRLARLTIHLPPLRTRDGDVPLLIDYWLSRISVDFGARPELTSAARHLLEAYAFPGNVRELQNVLLEACAAAPWGPTIDVGHLPDRVRWPKREATPGFSGPVPVMSLAEAKARLERALLPAALARCGGNREAAARLLGIDAKTLRTKLAAMK
jgi:DNA-binding NtrC family response regulator